MSALEKVDEIIRLIDETLDEVTVDADTMVELAVEPLPATRPVWTSLPGRLPDRAA